MYPCLNIFSIVSFTVGFFKLDDTVQYCTGVGVTLHVCTLHLSTPTMIETEVQRCIALLQSQSIRVCVFDMDLTAVAAHSQGCLLRSELDEYLNKATPSFRAIVPKLHGAGIGLAIATHSDEAEYGGHVQPETHILGAELARALVEYHFDADVAKAFFIMAYNPRVRGVTDHQDLIKRHHMRHILEWFAVPPHQIVFFDDIEATVKDCVDYCNVRSIQVDATAGFQCKDILNNLLQL
jgi:hypothetical protein